MDSTYNKSVTSVTNRLLLMKFFSEFIFIYPLITIMYSQHGHVSASGIGVILGLGLALSVLLEIPTGIVADKVPRKYVLLASLLCKALAITIWLLFPYFTGYIVAAVVFAFSAALESGTLQAYLYGALGEEHKKAFGKFWAKVSAMVMISYTVAYVFTTIIGINYPLLLGLSIIPPLIALVVCITLPLDRLSNSTQELKPKIFASAVEHIKNSPDLIRLIVTGVVVVALAEVMIEYLSLYYFQVGVAVRYVPIMMAIGNILGAITFWWLHKWENVLDKNKVLLVIMFSLIFITSFFFGVVFAVIGMLLFTRFIRLLQVQYESNIQHLASDKARATISSISSFISSLIAAATMVLVGLFAIDNSIVRPIRIALLAGTTIYLLLLILNRINTKGQVGHESK